MKEYLFYLYIAILLADAIIGTICYKKYESSLRIIVWLLYLTLLSEICSFITSKFDLGKAIPYHIYNPIEAILISCFFIYTIKIKEKKGWILGSVVFWILATFIHDHHYNKLKVLNSRFLVFESFIIIIMSLYALYSILINESIKKISGSPQFLLWACFLLYFSSTFFFWSFISILYKQKIAYYNIAIYTEMIMNFITYIGIGLTLFFSPKMLSDE